MRDVQVRELEATQLANQSAVDGENIVFWRLRIADWVRQGQAQIG